MYSTREPVKTAITSLMSAYPPVVGKQMYFPVFPRRSQLSKDTVRSKSFHVKKNTEGES